MNLHIKENKHRYHRYQCCGSTIRNGEKSGSAIRDEQNGSYFWLKIPKLFDADPNPGYFLTLDPGLN
jgi:hypothetical protein